MTNPEKGEVQFTHEGKRYTLVMNTMALAKLQRVFNTKETHKEVVRDAQNRPVTVEVTRDVIADIQEIDRLVKAKSLEHIVAFFWAALQKHHPEMATLDDAATLLDVAGAEAASALMEAAGLGSIDPKDLEALARGNPLPAQVTPKRKRGRGGNFTSMPAPAA